MINVKNSVKTLGVHVCPSLSWKDEFERVKNKMKSSIKKLMTVDMKLHQACFYFNTCMLTNVIFFDVEWLILIKNNVKNF